MGDWSYVLMAYVAVWGTVTGYALLLQRRIKRSRAGVDHMRRTIEEARSTVRQEEPVCDVASVP